MSRDIPINLIDPDPDQPRKHFDESKLAELSQSLQVTGLAVPILLRPNADRYIIVHGERRYRAAMLAGWGVIAADVRDLTPDEAAWIALTENVQRADLSPIEEAKAYKERLDTGLTQTELGQRIGKSQSYIAQKLRLLNMPEPLQFYLDKGVISEGHARQLLRLRKFYQPQLARDFSCWIEFFEQIGREHWGFAILGILDTIRPLENAPFKFISKTELDSELKAFYTHWLPDPDNPHWAIEVGDRLNFLEDVGRLFVEVLERKDWKLSQWEVAAFWWASCTATFRISVHDLQQLISYWEHSSRAAVHFIQCFGYDWEDVPIEDLEPARSLYDGYVTDIKMAHLQADFDFGIATKERHSNSTAPNRWLRYPPSAMIWSDKPYDIGAAMGQLKKQESKEITRNDIANLDIELVRRLGQIIAFTKKQPTS